MTKTSAQSSGNRGRSHSPTRIDEVELLVPNDEATSLVVRITTDSGMTGLGESAAWGYPEAVREIVDRFRPSLVGADPSRIEQHWQNLYHLAPFRGNLVSAAVSAVDLALWDLKGKHLGVPVWDLIGGQYRHKVRLHLLLEGSSPEQIVSNARTAAEDGFTAVKFDPLLEGYQDQSVPQLLRSARDVVSSVRSAVGIDVDMILEIHRKLNPMNAILLAESLTEFAPLGGVLNPL